MHSLLFTLLALGQVSVPIQPRVELEEDIYSYEPAQNGAGPMWCSGSACLVRIGDVVVVSGLETLKAFRPLNNCRWLLFARTGRGWALQQSDTEGRTREPCPIVGYPDGRLFLSANPTLATGAEDRAGPAHPEILQFSAVDPKAPPLRLSPRWAGAPPFTEHSYRTFAADGPCGEFILLQNVGYDRAEWTFCDREGNWSAQGQLIWPIGTEYDKPEPIRLCYPNVVLKSRAVHFCGVSDIVEPYEAWRKYKKELTGQNWDYDFRRLFYTWTSDITTGKFHGWIEIASRDKTCGRLMPMDLWVDNAGRAHVLWTERAIDPRLREKFFPGEKQSQSLNYALVRDGKVALRRTLAVAEEGVSQVVPEFGRFHVTPNERLFAVYYLAGTDVSGTRVSENRMVEVSSDGSIGKPVVIPLQNPLSNFFTATTRGGSPPAYTLDMLGVRVGASARISYVRALLR